MDYGAKAPARCWRHWRKVIYMNRTKIDWTDYTWNPVTGCWGPGGTPEKPNRCPYCYAQRIAKRLAAMGKIYGDPKDPFWPRFHGDRIGEPLGIKRPGKIFVCSMGDLFGDWVPLGWIEDVLKVVYQSPWNIYQFLTKNPKRYQELNPWPGNCWVGATATDQAMAKDAIKWLAGVDASVRYLSCEPLLGRIDLSSVNYMPIEWLIIGAQTGPGGHQPDALWVKTLHDMARKHGIPVWTKENLTGIDIKEWPIGVKEL